MNHALSSPASAGGGWHSRAIERLLAVVVVLWLFLLSDAIIPLAMLGEQPDFTDEQKLVLQNVFKPFVIIALALFVVFFRGMVTILIRNPIFVLLLLWMWMSTAWSMDPDVTLRRSVLHSTFVLMACFAAYRYEFKEIIAILFFVTVLVVLSSVYFIVLDPSLGFNPDGRGARGAFQHKNTLGNFLVVGIAVAATALRLRIVPRLFGYGALIASLVLLVMANSTTAMLIVAVMFGVYVLVALKEQLPFQLLAVLVAFFLALLVFGTMLLIANIDEFFLLLGRDATLTGRDEVWHYAGRMIQERVLLGYGYSAFWETEPIFSYVNETLKWHITHAHNGFLEMWLELGVIGMGLLIAFLIIIVYRAAFRPLPEHAAALILPFFVAMIVNDLVETHLFVYKHFGWIIMVIFVFVTTPGLEKIRKRPG